MKAREIFAQSCSFLCEKPGEDADAAEHYLSYLNVLLQEALPTENSIRRAREEEELSDAPLLLSGEDEVPYDSALVRIALPYGLASWFFQDLMDVYQAENYRSKYIGALNDARQCIFVSIEPAYDGGD